jgi:hypothetical protein
MKPNDIYKWTPIRVSNDCYELERIVGSDVAFCMSDLDFDKNDKIELRYYVDFTTDGERGVSFFSVWFYDKPVMICETAGRGNRDHTEGFITDIKSYRAMLDYMRDTLLEEDEIENDVYAPDEDFKDIGVFYGIDATDYYNPDTVKPKYEVGDIVLGEVQTRVRNGDRMKSITIQTRTEIQKISKYNPVDTYHCRQLDRTYTMSDGYNQIDSKPGEGNLFCTLNDKIIIKKI